ncbi:hypothetical protein N2152v2_003707 [Parachlorella kessleri]
MPVASLQRQCLASRARIAYAPFKAGKAALRRPMGLQVQAMIREWPDPEFVEETLAEFPDKGVANVEEARVLYENGYVYLDVRSKLEYDEVGKVKGSVNIPLVNARRVYNAQERKKEVVKEDNPDFIAMVEKRFPNKDAAKLLVACSNGTAYSIDALEMLDEAGYVNIVGLKGGYNAWFRTFDNKLGRRRSGEYAENYTHDGDSCGIHSSGAGFDRVDAIERYTPPVY